MTEFELGAKILVSKHLELNKSACECVSEIQRVVSNEKETNYWKGNQGKENKEEETLLICVVVVEMKEKPVNRLKYSLTCTLTYDPFRRPLLSPFTLHIAWIMKVLANSSLREIESIGMSLSGKSCAEGTGKGWRHTLSEDKWAVHCDKSKKKEEIKDLAMKER